MKVTLKIRSKNTVSEQELKLGDLAFIGRSSSSSFQVDDEKISGRHCQLNLKIDRLELHDLDSKNGTYLNGIRIDRSEVFIGDEIQLGDTVITLEESKMPQDAIDALTFPGPFKDRLNYELKADFTGARIQNQLNNKRPVAPDLETKSHEQEIKLRRKIKSNIKLSKQEIRLQNSFLAITSTILDGATLVAVMFLPVIFAGRIIPSRVPHNQRLIFLIASVVIFGLVFFIVNFKKMKFTFGERVAGIKELYDKQ